MATHAHKDAIHGGSITSYDAIGFHKDPRKTSDNHERWSLAKDVVDDFDYRALLSPETRKALEEWEQKNMKVTK